MEFQKGSGRVLKAFLLLTYCTFISGEKLVLDAHSDQSKEWFEVSCIYNDDPADFWVYGCPADLRSGEDTFPQRKGFWAPCSAQRCEIHYFGGSRTAQVKSITLSLYARGSPEVLVTSKYSVLDPEYTNEVGRVSLRDAHGWYDTTIQMGDQSRALLLNFTLTSGADDMLMLDKIILDIGEDNTFPPELPPTTTPIPIVDDVITLDKESDYWILWNQNCSYLDDHYYMWAYGCAANPMVDTGNTGAVGFWSSCAKPKCRLQYVANPILAQPAPTSITVKGFLEGNVKIDLILQTNPLDFMCENCTSIGNVTASGDGGWKEATFQVASILSKTFMINVELTQEDGGTMLLDKVSLKLKSQQPPGGGGGGSGDSDSGSGSWFRMEWTTLCVSFGVYMITVFRLN